MIYANSRYKDSNIIIDRNGTKVIDGRKKKTFNQSNCTLYMFKQGDSVDNLAHTYYGSTYYNWAILDNNPQYLSELDINIGDYLLMPNYNEVVNG